MNIDPVNGAVPVDAFALVSADRFAQSSSLANDCMVNKHPLPFPAKGLLLWHLAGCCILAVAAGCIFRGLVMWSLRRRQTEIVRFLLVCSDIALKKTV